MHSKILIQIGCILELHMENQILKNVNIRFSYSGKLEKKMGKTVQNLEEETLKNNLWPRKKDCWLLVTFRRFAFFKVND